MMMRVFGSPVLHRALPGLALSALAAVMTPAWADARVSLNQVVPVTLPNNDTELRLVFSGNPPAPQAYRSSVQPVWCWICQPPAVA